jgi:hypothetical protein
VTKICWWAAAAIAALPGTAWAQADAVRRAEQALAGAERAVAQSERRLARWSRPELRTFASEGDFAAYLAAVKQASDAIDERDSAGWQLQSARESAERQRRGTTGDKAQDDEQPEAPCAPEDKVCRLREVDAASEGMVVVTGSALRAVSPNVTNVQEAGVDEGDIVKQVGRHLLVLQDGRLFVIDMEGGPGRDRLALVDRADVYRDPDEDAWYDEVNVQGDRVIVTGYSYALEVSEIAVFRLGPDGRLRREGVFQIKSYDYYSRDNYSSRIVGDRLVLYTPLPVSELGSDLAWPRLRRVRTAAVNGSDPAAEAEADFAAGPQLLSPDRLYRPLATVHRPVIHMITTCNLGAPANGVLGCESRGFVGSPGREFYVAGEQAFLWTRGDSDRFSTEEEPSCAPGFRTPRADTIPAIVYRIGLTSGTAGVLGASGAPFNQLGLDAGQGRFRALVGWPSLSCVHAKNTPLAFLDIAESAFSRRLRPAPDRAFTAMPDIGATRIENRFTERFLFFGGRTQLRYWSDDEPSGEGFIGGGDVVVVPLDRPGASHRVRLPHRVWRADRIGDNAIFTGYSEGTGLDVSVLDSRGGAPRLASSIRLEGRFESEGRSHAFNSAIGEDGSGLAGLPTVLDVGGSGRSVSRSAASDVSFLSISARGDVRSIGALEAQAEGEGDYEQPSSDPTIYSCQVSCIDWYGNSRPLFVGNRVFALTATELVEGRVIDARIAEVQRIDLTKADLPAHMRPAAAPVSAPLEGGSGN